MTTRPDDDDTNTDDDNGGTDSDGLPTTRTTPTATLEVLLMDDIQFETEGIDPRGNPGACGVYAPDFPSHFQAI